MTLVRDKENKKVVISHKSPRFNVPFINKSHTVSSEKNTDIDSENLKAIRLTSALKYLLKLNLEPKKPIITSRGRSNVSRKKRNLIKVRMDLDHEVSNSPQKCNSDRIIPSVRDHIYSMDYQKVSANPPGYRSKPFLFR